MIRKILSTMGLFFLVSRKYFVMILNG